MKEVVGEEGAVKIMSLSVKTKLLCVVSDNTTHAQIKEATPTAG